MSPVAPTESVLDIAGLGFAHGPQTVFSDWSARVPRGLSFLCGDEGCGKTTVLRLLAGVLPLQTGKLRLLGQLDDPSSKAWQAQVFWADPRDASLDPLQARICLREQGERHPRFDEALALDIAQAFGLDEHLEKSMFMLSTGSRRKLLLSAAFASGCALTLIDEPFAGLDRASSGVLMELLQEAAGHPARAWLVADHAAPTALRGGTCLQMPAPADA